MIELKINETTYPLRTNWNEVTLKEYCEIVKAKDTPIANRLKVATGIPMETINALSFTQFVEISAFIGFMDVPETIEAFAQGYESEFKIGESEYWKIEKAKQLLGKVDNPLLVSAELVDLYTSDKDGKGGKDINNEPVTHCIGKALFFCAAFTNSLRGLNG